MDVEECDGLTMIDVAEILTWQVQTPFPFSCGATGSGSRGRRSPSGSARRSLTQGTSSGFLGDLHDVRSRQVCAQNELGREVSAFAPVVRVVPSHGCEAEARIRWPRVRGDVREDLRLAGGRPLLGIAWRRGRQRSRKMPCGVHSGATWSAPRAANRTDTWLGHELRQFMDLDVTEHRRSAAEYIKAVKPNC